MAKFAQLLPVHCFYQRLQREELGFSVKDDSSLEVESEFLHQWMKTEEVT